MTKEVYLDTSILKNELIASVKKFGSNDPVNSNKFYYKYYQDNNPKHKSYLCKTPELLILLPKVRLLIQSKMCGFI